MNCTRCPDTGRTCEEHPDKLMGHDDCRGAGDPWPDCNPPPPGKMPAPPPDFEIDC